MNDAGCDIQSFYASHCVSLASGPTGKSGVDTRCISMPNLDVNGHKSICHRVAVGIKKVHVECNRDARLTFTDAIRGASAYCCIFKESWVALSEAAEAALFHSSLFHSFRLILVLGWGSAW